MKKKFYTIPYQINTILDHFSLCNLNYCHVIKLGAAYAQYWYVGHVITSPTNVDILRSLQSLVGVGRPDFPPSKKCGGWWVVVRWKKKWWAVGRALPFGANSYLYEKTSQILMHAFFANFQSSNLFELFFSGHEVKFLALLQKSPFEAKKNKIQNKFIEL